MCLAISYLQVTLILPIKFQVNRPFGQENKFKIDFQDGNCGSHIAIPIRTILGIFDLQVAQVLPNKFQVKWPIGSGEEVKNRTQ